MNAPHPAPAASATPWFEPLLAALPRATVAVFGDCCVDAYWWLSGDGERSVETGLTTSRVARQEYGLGAAGNVAVNLVDLGATRVELVGAIGDDVFGRELRRLAAVRGIVLDGLVDAGPGWQTMVYAKPMLGGAEQPRIDFGAGNRLDPALAARLVAALERAAARCGAVVVNQQVGGVLSDPELVGRINALIASHPRTRFVVDARSGADRFRGAVLKLNAGEAARLVGAAPQSGPLPEEEVRAHALELHRRSGCTVYVTRGERGLVIADAGVVAVLPGIQQGGRIDPVGAGDAAVACIAACLAAGVDPVAAGRLANLAAAVTVRKLHTTGTATPAELRALAAGADHLHCPDLAEDPRRARFAPGSEIEIVREPAVGAIAHAIFDHDGTISTLRQGWEAVMEPMMVRAVLGERLAGAQAALYQEILAAVRELIARTTGIQTLAQMRELAELVRRFGFVPADAVLDHHGYKRIYNQALMEQVRGRMAKLASGELQPADFAIRGAVELLRALRARGVRLYLASGTDEADVRAEAEVMGYAGLFDGGIHGAVGDLAVEAKRDVMDRIMRQGGIDGRSLLVVGDGPVEMREGRRRGALCLGIASDEPRRYGLDPVKRTRLIRAGADLIVGDFTQLDRLMPLIGMG